MIGTHTVVVLYEGEIVVYVYATILGGCECLYDHCISSGNDYWSVVCQLIIVVYMYATICRGG